MSEASPAVNERVERLNAYLDGELTGDQRAQLERDLATDPALQGELQRLERAWNLLDALPRADVAADFTRTTVEMAALGAADELAEVQTTRPRRLLLDACLATAGAIVAAAAGFLLVDAWRTPPDALLLDDLPVIEHVELYGRADPSVNVEFLRLVRDRKLFHDLPPVDVRRP